MDDVEIAKQWMEDEKDDYIFECDSIEDALQYLVEDCNSECATNLSKEELTQIAKEVLGL